MPFSHFQSRAGGFVGAETRAHPYSHTRILGQRPVCIPLRVEARVADAGCRARIQRHCQAGSFVHACPKEIS